jgi:hypothetical protein
MPVKALTVRNLPPEVAKAIRDKAKKERRSLNQTVVSLLEEATGARPRARTPTVHHDLDHLFGTWTKKEADEFDSHLKESRSAIDPRDWE